MLLEFSRCWPFVRPHRCVMHTHAHTAGGTPHHAHRSWVRHTTSGAIGWIHHHERDGYVVELRNGRLETWGFGSMENIEEPK